MENVRLHPEDLKNRDNYLRRFVDRSFPRKRTDDPFVDAVIKAYEGYWDKVLLQELDSHEGERFLYKQLSQILSFNQEYSDTQFDLVIDSLKKLLFVFGIDPI